MGGMLAVSINVGDHITRSIFGLKVNVDDLASCAVAGLIILGLGFYLRAKATSGLPGKFQLSVETIIDGVENQVKSTMGDSGRAIVPLALVLFFYILVANWLELIPTGHNPQFLPAPTGDINFTLAMGLFVILLVHVTWVRHQGLKSYLGHYMKPWFLTPFNVIEELVKPVTLALRLFGNIFSGGVLLLLVAALPGPFLVGVPILDTVVKIIDGLFIGPIQAFIFAILTILYFESALSGGH